MVEEVKEKQNEVAWSMDQEVLKKLSELMVQADVCYINGDYGGCYQRLKACKNNFVQSLNPKERQEMLLREKQIELNSRYIHLYRTQNEWNNSVLYQEGQIKIMRKAIINCHKVPAQIDEYRVRIMDLLNFYGYLSKKIKDKTELGI